MRLPGARRARRVGWLTRIAARWQARRAGRGDGLQNKPDAGSTTPSVKELGIVGARHNRLAGVSAYMASLVQSVDNFLKQLDQRRLDLKALKTQIEAQAHKIDGYYNHKRQVRQEQRDNALADLKRFKQENGLERDARYAKDNWPWAIMMVALLADAIANAPLLMGASQNWLLGAVPIAFILSVLNLTVGLLAGLYGFRETRHVKPSRRVIGGIVLTALCVVGLFINLFIAHFRSLAQESEVCRTATAVPPDPFCSLVQESDVYLETLDLQLVWHNIFANPFDFVSIFALALFFLGLLVFGIGYKEGTDGLGPGFCDIYPGYARVDKIYRGRDKQLHAVIDKRNARLDGLYVAYTQWANRSTAAHTQLHRKIAPALGELRLAQSLNSKLQAHFDNHADLMIAAYRWANERERTCDKPAWPAPQMSSMLHEEDVQRVIQAAVATETRLNEDLATLDDLKTWLAEQRIALS